jgi:Family of unknown function (DUF5808)
MSKTNKSPFRWVGRIIGGALVLAALGQELSKPASERTWNGKVASVVPYDFRRPTLARLRERLWAPEDPHVMTPQLFGVGWSVNFGRLMSLLRKPAADRG